ncbi:heme A synthase [Sporolactobacillus sp. THM7-7]|nr:heme A synthase [Sporolactobacillus sp. THM7-7]
MKDRYLRVVSVIGLIFVFLVVLMGALVTNTGSQLGCGTDFPLCRGQVIPDSQQHQTWIEYSHRFVAGIAAILVVVQAVWIWIRLKKTWEIKFLSVASVFFIFLQAALGAAAVKWGQSSVVLALHFGISLLSFSSMLLITFVVFEETYPGARRIVPEIRRGMRWNVILLSIYSYVLIYSGAFVRHTDSTLGCTDFPLCNGQLTPDTLISKAGIQYIHRFLAFVLLIWLIVTLIVSVRRYKAIPSLSVVMLFALIFTVLQAIAGIFVIQTEMSLVFLMLHALFVTCYYGLLMILLMLTLRPEKKSRI